MTGLTGIVLAAGAGSRFGGPKALARMPDGTPWIVRAVAALRGGGCDRVLVVLGAAADAAADLVPADAERVIAADWAEGVSASLRAGLRAASGDVVVIPVDTPDISADAVRRVVAAGVLAQAVYGGRPGHPVFIPAGHLAAVASAVTGDRGARPYLVAHGATEVECGDLWPGADVDTR